MQVEMQPRITVNLPKSGNIVLQPRSEWIDAANYNAAIFRVEVDTLTNCNLRLRTSVIADEQAFSTLHTITATGPSNLVTPPTASVPVMRFLNWILTATADDAVATFRVVVLLKQL